MNVTGPSLSITPPVIAPAAPRTPGQGGLGGGQASFADVVRNAVAEVDKSQQASVLSIQDLMAGRTQDVLPVVAAVAKADMSFKLLLGVRNKVIEAYKQTMNMQV
jgi:flagellar hook-basal body complex protein FliE